MEHNEKPDSPRLISVEIRTIRRRSGRSGATWRAISGSRGRREDLLRRKWFVIKIWLMNSIRWLSVCLSSLCEILPLLIFDWCELMNTVGLELFLGGLTQRSWPIWLSETVLSMEMYSNLKSFSVELNIGTIAQKPIERCICFGNFSQFIALRRERSSWVSHYLWQASFRCHPQNKVPSQKNNPVGLAASLERKSLGRIK